MEISILREIRIRKFLFEKIRQIEVRSALLFNFFLSNSCPKLVGTPCINFSTPKTCLLCLRPSSRSGSSGSLNSGSNRLKNKAYLNDVSFSLIKTDFLLYKHYFGTNEKVKSNRYFFTQKLGKTNRPQKSSKILDLCLHQNYQEVKCTRGKSSKIKESCNFIINKM